MWVNWRASETLFNLNNENQRYSYAIVSKLMLLDVSYSKTVHL